MLFGQPLHPLALATMALVVSATASLGVMPTPTPLPIGCERPLMVAPPHAPAGSVVELTGECQPIHSGASAEVHLDAAVIGRVSGNTGGDFRTLIRMPPQTVVGPHRLRLTGLFVGSETALEITAARPCVGDCDGGAAVTIEELITGVGVVSGERLLAACPALDFDGDQRASIGELVASVAASLEGCTPAPALTSFAGLYTRAASMAGDYSPGAVQRGEAEVTALGFLALLVNFPYGAGMARLTAMPSVDGGLAVTGTVDFQDGSRAPATGTAVAIADGDRRWISAAVDLAEFPGASPAPAFLLLSSDGAPAP